MEYDQSLLLFMGTTGVSNYAKLPSWTPDSSNSNVISEIATWERYEASRNSKTSFHFSTDEQVLYVQGAVIDSIVTTHTEFADFPSCKDVHTFIQQLCMHLSPDICQEDYVALLMALFDKAWKAGHQAFPSLRNVIRRFLGLVSETVLGKGLAEAKFFAHNEMSKRLDRKVLFRTTQGRLGFSSQHISPDDAVVLLSGCKLPMIIRSDGEAWRIVAPAFVHSDGIMEGGLWKDDIELQEFGFFEKIAVTR
ncbi:hypothetical protein EKO04_002060 [Ascochyta lentis]|uniref:Uncharacterized protein n=1 Tax=Ascochyta lentis TaxID=205686 RepID=A0A8H7J942_9PLEO|nr:hypothetical protein EKO04_002060 [Ascochyta lentis]